MKRAVSLREIRDPSIAILPTAAARQVQQRWNKETRAERARLCAEHPWPGQYEHPQQREAMIRAKTMREIVQTPELIVTLALLQGVDRDRRQGMIESLVPTAVVSPLHRKAVEIIRSTLLNFGEQTDLSRALDRLRQEDAV